ncbi:MAG: hypothetical protein QOJ97_1853 [Solirubrobacteraceae bacterium]|jgi:hypothetical protein|nr:hypothetical protein [Solirubrobacteraceae bacterium]
MNADGRHAGRTQANAAFDGHRGAQPPPGTPPARPLPGRGRTLTALLAVLAFTLADPLEVGAGARGAGFPAAQASDDSAYSAFRPLATGAGASDVPSLAAQGVAGGGWAFETWGSPDAIRPTSRGDQRVKSVAVSRDGSAGWAIGSGAADGASMLYRFDGTAWQRCDPSGVGRDVAKPDPACAGLAALSAQGLVLESIATIATDDGSFEATAVGWLPPPAGEPPASVRAVILRYRDGHWTPTEVPSDAGVGLAYQLRSVAFTDAGVGWAYGQPVTGQDDAVMLRFGGDRWTMCAQQATCDGGALPHHRFIPAIQGSALIAAGNRVFLAGTRSVFNNVLPDKHYPVILSTTGGRWDATNGFDPAGPGKSPGSASEGTLNSFAVAGDGHTEGWARLGPPDAGASTSTLRLSPGGQWQPWSPSVRTDALRDHPTGAELGTMFTAPDGTARPFMTTANGPLVQFDSAENRWRVLPAPFDPSAANPFTAGQVQAMAPDGRGGLWLVQDGGTKGPFFHRYTDRPRRPVFADVPQPFAGGGIRNLAGSPDGTVWLAGDGAQLARYDRIAGWSTLKIAGWDKAAAVNALALAPDGTGVAVGDGGRIATLGPQGAEAVCGGCGTGEALRAVDVSPDGSDLAGGDHGALLFRAAGGQFHAVDGPSMDRDARITGVALPTADSAWVANSRGQVFAGHRAGAGWTWDPKPENVNAQGELLSTNGDRPQAIRAIALAPDGSGYAVGDAGTVLERSSHGDWKRIPLGISDDFTSVALPEGGGTGALIGADGGAIWTRVNGELRPARSASPVDAYGGARVSGLALLPGYRDDQAEAWAALDGPGLGGALLHYASDPSESLLTPAKPVTPLPDAPAPRAGELSFVAFGKSDCANDSVNPCPGPSGTDGLSDLISRRIVDRVTASTKDAKGASFALFTGDANNHGGDLTSVTQPALLNEWVDLVARPLDQAGVPVLGAIGVLDLSESARCVERNLGVCVSSDQATHAGANFFWRQAMVDRVGQDGAPQRYGGLVYRPVHDDLASPTPQTVDAVPTGGARTHYAVDVLRDGRTLARLVFVDNSLGSLRASDPLQQPPEPRGQLAWLDRVLASRPPGSRAVVVSTSPSYAYRPATVADAAGDGASLEEVILRNRVSAVVSGRLGWNGLYYTIAPGLHCPGPAGGYPDRPPAGAGGCGRAQGVTVPDATSPKLSPPVPFVVSSSAGGKLAQEAGEGYWHGYSVVRLDASGDPAKTVVEQRPILDWVAITASARRLRPGQSMTLQGVGREPPAADTPPRYHQLSSPAITHRYDLLLADPQKPWMPYRDESGDYVPMSERYPNCSVACIDRQTGEVSTGKGASGRVYGVGLLSVGGLAATYPLSFDPGSPREPLGAAAASAPRALAATARPLGVTPSQTTGTATPPSPSGAPSAEPLSVPGFAPPTVSEAAVPHPPTQVSPSPPAAKVSAAATDLRSAPPAMSSAPRVSPAPPSAPQIKPAPKMGVRREPAAQEMGVAATDPQYVVLDELADPRDPLLVDIGDGPPLPHGAAATRKDTRRTDLAMTALTHGSHPSTWGRDALYGGGLVIAGLVLASGWMIMRPGARRPTAAVAESRPWSGRDR